MEALMILEHKPIINVQNGSFPNVLKLYSPRSGALDVSECTNTPLNNLTTDPSLNVTPAVTNRAPILDQPNDIFNLSPRTRNLVGSPINLNKLKSRYDLHGCGGLDRTGDELHKQNLSGDNGEVDLNLILIWEFRK